MTDFPLEKRMIRQPVLRRPPLKSVVCQMTFQEVLGLSPSDVRPLQREFASDYPILSREDAVKVNIEGSTLAPTNELRRTFQFKDAAEDWTVTLAPDSLALETRAYIDFEDFARRWYRISGKVAEALEITHQERLGLRYINQIQLDGDTGLAEVIRSELISLVGANAERTRDLVHSFQEAVFRQADGFINLRHGMAEIEGSRSYILDIDYFVDERQEFEIDAQLQALMNFNHAIFELFRWSVTDEQFSSFTPEENEDA